jgi:gliding motility-associated-like protein
MKIGIALKLTTLFVCLLAGGMLFAQENCANGIDDDNDGLIDLNDTEDCFCEGSSGGEIQSIIPNPSFEEMDDCCPSSFSQLFCAQDWVQATNATSDYFNTCDYMPPCVPTPLPDGEGLVGAFFGAFNGGGNPWYEYVGTCLISEMLAGESYTLQFDISATFSSNFEQCSPITQGPVDVTLFGLETCPSFPIPTTSCPIPNGWVELGTANYQPVDEWNVLTINFTPSVDIEAVMLGAPCDLDPDEYGVGPNGELLYCMFDDLVLNESSFFSGIIDQEGGNCLGDLILSAAESDVFSYQWYHEGVALVGETDPTLNLGETGYEIGVYQVMVSNIEDGTCTIAETEVSPAENSPVQFEADVLSGCAPLEVNFTNLTDPDFIQSSQWSFQIGSSTENDPTFTFEQSGVFDISLTVVTPGNCITSVTLEDYIEVFPTEAPEMNYSVLGGCPPYNVAFTSNAPEGGTCLWDFGDLGVFGDCEPVLTISQEGTYTATLDVSGVTGCSEPGELSFTVAPNNPPSFELQGPSSICPEITDSIQAVFEDGMIEWTNGMSGTFLEISNPGWYSATFVRDDGCEAIDSIFIPEKLPPVIRASDKEACEGDPVQLFAESDVSDVWWRDLSDDHVVIVYEGGTYIAEAENECGLTQKEVKVTLTDCSCQIYVPNSFTPNGDGINDLFKPSISCELQFYEILIFDRWGREVFKSNDPSLAWSGATLHNPDYFPESQVFNYIIRYDNALRPNSDREEIKGFIQLLR